MFISCDTANGCMECWARRIINKQSVETANQLYGIMQGLNVFCRRDFNNEACSALFPVFRADRSAVRFDYAV